MWIAFCMDRYTQDGEVKDMRRDESGPISDVCNCEHNSGRLKISCICEFDAATRSDDHSQN